MAGRTPIEPSYIVDLLDIADQIMDIDMFDDSRYDIVIPVYSNNFSKDIARKLVFLAHDGEIYQSIKSEFICDIDIMYRDRRFVFTDRFESGNESGYVFGSIEIHHPDSENEPIFVSYYWR